jgi:hypothetical protein
MQEMDLRCTGPDLAWCCVGENLAAGRAEQQPSPGTGPRPVCVCGAEKNHRVKNNSARVGIEHKITRWITGARTKRAT